MVSVETIGRRIDFARYSIAESTAFIFVIFLNFIFTPIIEIKIFEKQFFALKKFSYIPAVDVGEIPTALGLTLFFKIPSSSVSLRVEKSATLGNLRKRSKWANFHPLCYPFKFE